MPERKVFEVHIEQGHKYGAKVVLRGEAGMSELGVLPGDVIFVLEPKQHKTFKRVQNDIVMEKVGCIHGVGWPVHLMLDCVRLPSLVHVILCCCSCCPADGGSHECRRSPCMKLCAVSPSTSHT